MFKKLLLVSIILSNLVGCSNEIDYNQFDIPQQDNYENYKKDHHIDEETTPYSINSIKSYKEKFDEKCSAIDYVDNIEMCSNLRSRMLKYSK